jgi:hypothetical protein
MLPAPELLLWAPPLLRLPLLLFRLRYSLCAASAVKVVLPVAETRPPDAEYALVGAAEHAAAVAAAA